MKTKTITISLALASCLLVTTLPAAYPQTGNTPESVVRQLYSAYGQGDIENNPPEKTRILDKPVSVYEEYFTNRLAKLIVKDRTEEIRSKELGRLDFSILYGSQDCEGIKNIRIDRELGSNNVVVFYDQNDEKDVMKVRHVMVQTKVGWRISDIQYSTRVTKAFPGPIERWSLLRLLTE